MRNLKKIVAVLLTVALLASMMVTALAATPVNTDKALKLQAIKLMAGTEADLRLADSLNRIEGLAFAIRAAGKEAEALAMTDADVATELAKFTDSDKIPGWGAKYAAYAIKTGITVGKGNGLLGPVDPLSGPMFLVFVAKAGMGYTEATTAETLIDLVVAAKIFTPAQAVAVYLKSGLIRDDAALVLYNAAMTGVNKDGTALITSLVNAGFVSQQVAFDAGFVPTAPVAPALEVQSVTATNNKQVVVIFNQAVDKESAETKGNYTFSGTAGAATSAVLSGNSVTVTFTTFQPQQGSVDVTVKNVKKADKSATVADTTKSVKFFDATIPSVSKVEVTGPKELTVTFDEPITSTAITSTSNFTIDNNTYSVGSVAASGDYAVIVTLGSTLPAGDHKIKVNAGGIADPAIKDFAGFFAAQSEISFTYAVDSIAPVATLSTASQNSVKVVFDKTITVATRANVVIYHTYNNNSAYDADSYTWAADGKSVTATWNSVYLPVGSSTIYVKAGTDPNFAKDGWGNKLADTVLSADITADTTAPTITSVTFINSTTLEVVFSEAVTGADVAGNYTLKDGDTTIGITSSVLKAGTTATYTITTSTMNGGSYAFTAKGMKDTSVAANAMADFATTVTATDKVKPTVTGTGVYSTDGKKIVVSFSEAMATSGTYSVLDKANYQVIINAGTAKDLSSIDGATIAMNSGNKSVIIGFPADQNFVAAGADSVVVARVADLAGNVTANFTTPVTLSGDDVTDTNITEAKATASNKIELKLNTALSSIVVGKFNIETAGGNKAATSATYVNDGNTSIVTVVIDTADKFNTDLSNLVNVEFDIGAVTTSLGTSNSGVVTHVKADAEAPIKDYVAPAVVSTVTNDANADGHIDNIVVTYSEALYAASVADADYTVEGYEITGVVNAGATVTISVKPLASFDTAATPKVTLVGAVSDDTAQRNSLGAQSAVASTDGVAPVVITKITAAGTLTANGAHSLTFSEALNAASKTTIKAAVDAAFTETGAATVTSAWSSDDKTLTVTISGIAASPADDVVLAAIANQAATDVAGNASAALDVQN